MFHFDKNFGLFVGKLNDNKFHKHYALQMCVSLKPEMQLMIKNDNTEIVGHAFFISSNVAHKLSSTDIQLTILINPLSTIGLVLGLRFRQMNYFSLSDNLSQEICRNLNLFADEKLNFKNFCIHIKNILDQYKCVGELENSSKDNRIIKALEIFEKNFEVIYSLDEISALCNLSPSRFLHLFKENTQINFRRYQLWNRLVKSLPLLKNSSITETAYTCGFSDGSHYTRTFLETFGVNPKFFLTKE